MGNEHDLSTVDGFHAFQRALAGQPPLDLRSNAHAETDRIWSGMKEACEKKFGRAPSTNPIDQDDEGGILLAEAEQAESQFLALANSPSSTKESIEAAKQAFHENVLRWLNRATHGWPSRKQYEAQQRRLREVW